MAAILAPLAGRPMLRCTSDRLGAACTQAFRYSRSTPFERGDTMFHDDPKGRRMLVAEHEHIAAQSAQDRAAR